MIDRSVPCLLASFCSRSFIAVGNALMLNFRGIVTGHDAQARAIIQADAPPTRVETIGPKGPTFYGVWNTREPPARIDRASGEFPETGLIPSPPPGGTRIRILDIPPETEDFKAITEEESREHSRRLAWQMPPPPPGAHPTLHASYA